MNLQDQGFDREDGNVFPKVSLKTLERWCEYSLQCS